MQFLPESKAPMLGALPYSLSPSFSSLSPLLGLVFSQYQVFGGGFASQPILVCPSEKEGLVGVDGPQKAKTRAQHLAPAANKVLEG